jgi:GDP-L-fucose synthase
LDGALTASQGDMSDVVSKSYPDGSGGIRMKLDSKIYVAGHRGMVGNAIANRLRKEGFQNLILKTSSELDLRDAQATREFFEAERPEFVFQAAAKVGGILANNTRRGEFIYDNLQIQSSLIHSAYVSGTKKLLFLGSSCIYPKLCPQPIREEYLLTGPLEQTNEPYAIAKIAGIKMCEAYRDQYGFNAISLMPTNLYGPQDNFDLRSSHVLPALMRKVHQAKVDQVSEIVVWGSGTPMREFLYCEDLADACLYLMKNYDEKEIVNVGTGADCSIEQLAREIMEVVGYDGSIVFDRSKPDGTPRKLLDVSKLAQLGWKAQTNLREGLQETYRWFLENESALAA